MIKIGFTGTQVGMTRPQMNQVIDLLEKLVPDRAEAHHGMCEGADTEFHVLCGRVNAYMVGHPGCDRYGNSPKMVDCAVNELREVFPYLVRNQHIVDECEILIATPKEFEEQRRSGTWSTIRKARAKNRTIYIVFPDGSISTR